MKRLTSMSRKEQEAEARESWDLGSYKAATALKEINNDLLVSLLKASRKGDFDPSPFFDRSGRKWVAKLDELKEAFHNATVAKKAATPKKKRAGWTEERRQKTMATRAAKKAAREKEVNDLKSQIDLLTLQLVESEALVVKQAEEIATLKEESSTAPSRAGHVLVSKEQAEVLSQAFGLLQSVFAAEKTSEEPSVPSADYVDVLQETAIAQDPAPALSAPAVVPDPPKTDEEDLTKLSVFDLNKRATDLGLSPDMNKGRLVRKITAALKASQN